MSQRCDDQEPCADEWDADDPEAPQERDLSGDDDETATVPCPSCRRAVPDFADRCPYCGDWIVPSAGESRRRTPWFLFALAAAGLGILAWYVF